MNGIGAHTGQTYIQTFIFIYIDVTKNNLISLMFRNIIFVANSTNVLELMWWFRLEVTDLYVGFQAMVM
jgi:hypothetical protein